MFARLGSFVVHPAPDRDGADDQQALRLPGPDEDPRFTIHIKPRFRTKDRQAMRFAFDLWDYEDVDRAGERTHAPPVDRPDCCQRGRRDGNPPDAGAKRVRR